MLALVTMSRLAWLPVAVAQPVPIGPEFQVNTYTPSTQVGSAVAGDSAGNFVVVWHSDSNVGDTDVSSIQGRRYDSSGTAQGGQFQVNEYTTNGQYSPAVASDSAGNFVVVWESYPGAGTDTSESSIQGQRFDSAGTPVGGEFQVNTYTTNSQSKVAVASDSAGNFVVVWSSMGSAGTDTDDSSIQGQRYNNAGVPQGGQFQVNTYTTSDQYLPHVASDSAGNFVVVWQGRGAGSDTGTGIQAQRYDSAGLPLGGEFQVNSYTTNVQRYPAVASDSAGNFVVVWVSYSAIGPDYSDIKGQRFDSSGTPLGGEFPVNTYTTSEQLVPAVASDSTGNFVVVWGSLGSAGPDTSSWSIQGQQFDNTGAAQGGQFPVNTYTTSHQRFSAVASDSAGNFVVVWDGFGSAGSDTSNYSIQGQRFAPRRTTLLPGRVAIIKPGTLAKFVAKPATGDAFALPPAPTVAMGGALRIFDTSATAGDVTYALPGTGWLPLGPAGSKGYKYRGAGTVGDPCKVVLVKKRVIKGVCRGTGITLTPPFTGDIGIVLSLGTTDRYCAQFGGDEVKNDATLTKRKNAPAPGVCASPSGAFIDDTAALPLW